MGLQLEKLQAARSVVHDVVKALQESSSLAAVGRCEVPGVTVQAVWVMSELVDGQCWEIANEVYRQGKCGLLFIEDTWGGVPDRADVRRIHPATDDKAHGSRAVRRGVEAGSDRRRWCARRAR